MEKILGGLEKYDAEYDVFAANNIKYSLGGTLDYKIKELIIAERMDRKNCNKIIFKDY